MTLSNPLIPILRSFDEAKAAEFYLGFLGFVQDWTHRFEPSLPLYQQISLQRPDGRRCVLHLSEHHGDASPGSSIRIEWQGLADLQKQLIAKNYGYARPGLEVQPWGMNEMRIADPFGNRLVFFEDIDAQ
ncbi:MAG: glyoxalase superfamily protein [Comamonas sp.]